MKTLVLLFCAALAVQAQVARRAPGFSLPDTTAKQHDIADYRGKIVLLDMIQTNCPKCLDLTGHLAQVKAKYGDAVQVLSVVTMPDNMKTVSEFIRTKKVTSPVLFDCGQVMASYMKITPSNPTIHFPHLFVIDKNGMIRRELDENSMSLANITAAVEAAK